MASPADIQSSSSHVLRPASVAPIAQAIHNNFASNEGTSMEPRAAARHGGRGRGRGQRGSRTSATPSVRPRITQPNVSHNTTFDDSSSHRPSTPNPPRNPRIMTTGRQFGGQLTTIPVLSAQTGEISQLDASAPEFVPGQAHTVHAPTSTGGARGGPTHKVPERPRQPRMKGPAPKSNARDIATRTHEDIINGVYECAICTSEITRKSKIWSCRTCWTVFHLSCVNTWSRNEGSAAPQRAGSDDEMPPSRQWRCPGCNLPKDALPSTYRCWCEKEIDPRSISGLPPHSCGQSCGRLRTVPKACPHPCELTCHAGPCMPCTHKGPTQSCFCGKNTTTRRCIDTNYDNGWSCGEICGDLLPCGEHTCPLPCHEGLCGSCEIQIPSRCYCGKAEKRLACSERKGESRCIRRKEDAAQDLERSWFGSFECQASCGRLFDCGKHSCSKGCHTQDFDRVHCPLSPDVVHQCPCGKTPLSQISAAARLNCEAPVPNCDKKCLRPLACGHPCQLVCHSGECTPCLLTISIACRCGRVHLSSICHQGSEERPQCMRTCKAIMNCGRHECGERCCSGERKATERQATKRRLRPLGAPAALDNGIEAEHICTRICDRSLKCGNHTCPELCHKGPCGTCREAVFDEISCHCGKTVLQPPLPCGTPSPPCRYPCDRPSECEHRKVAHNCHGDEEPCPKCPYLVEKPCICGKKNLKNQPCWLMEPRCGEVCGRKLRCGSHSCRQTCHRPGDCEDASKSCKQPCGKAKRICGHPCEESCHAPSACREDKPCQNKMLITCECQHLKQEIRCHASKTCEGNTKKILPCDDECARMARNQKLALALNIDHESHKDTHIPYSTDTLKVFRDNVKWCQTQERELRVFASEENEKHFRFKPMTSYQRSFLHNLAEDFGLDSESIDPEPHRHVCIFKTPRFVTAPRKTLAECIRIRAEAEALSVTENEQKLSADNIPFNGFALSGLPFGTLLDDVRTHLQPVFQTSNVLTFDATFLPSEEIVLKARPASSSTSIAGPAMASRLKALKPSLMDTIVSHKIAQAAHLCALDDSLNILRREQDTANVDGWSKVAAKGSVTPRSAPLRAAIGSKSVYTVLGSKLKEVKRKKEEEERRAEPEVVDDWETAIEKDEEAVERDATSSRAVNATTAAAGSAIEA